MPTAPSRSPHALATAALADSCVQCGLCLPACPTYALERLEPESPRGRIALVRAWALEAAAPTPAGDTHLDHCLGCRACEAVCPARVEFGPLLVAARAQQRGRRAVSHTQRAIEAMVARPRLLHASLGVYAALAPLLPRRWRVLPVPSAAPARGATMPAAGTDATRHRVALFTGCVARGYEAPARDALARICAHLGIDLLQPVGQGCCGSLHAHGGDIAGAQRLAARNRAAFAPDVPVLTLASGCHEAVAGAVQAPTVDALAWLAARADDLPLRPLQRRVALHLPCTQRHVVRSAAATQMLLARIPGLEVVPLDAGLGCCGSAGTTMLLDPVRAAAFRAPLLEQAQAAGVDAIASANIGCRLHLAGGIALPVLHPLELVAEALAPDTRLAPPA